MSEKQKNTVEEAQKTKIEYEVCGECEETAVIRCGTCRKCLACGDTG